MHCDAMRCAARHSDTMPCHVMRRSMRVAWRRLIQLRCLPACGALVPHLHTGTSECGLIFDGSVLRCMRTARACPVQVRITLVKSARSAASTWPSLMEGQYAADPAIFDAMEQKATLERFARENPGFDFSGAEISGNYQGGGPEFPQAGE